VVCTDRVDFVHHDFGFTCSRFACDQQMRLVFVVQLVEVRAADGFACYYENIIERGPVIHNRFGNRSFPWYEFGEVHHIQGKLELVVLQLHPLHHLFVEDPFRTQLEFELRIHVFFGLHQEV